ncbi:MAG TPA: ATP-binding cassette domain-containing protein [Papillibacter sp.]|nr:ATP-binding cassette domain-containing protein [Papillibacter sp.]
MKQKKGAPAVEVQGLTFTYAAAQTPVLKNCSMALHYGEFALLSGLSGEGKTTLLSAMAGVIPNCFPGVMEGEIFVDEEPVKGRQMAEIARKVGYVLQNPDSQIFHDTVADEIAFGCENLALPPEEIGRRIARSCALMGLNPADRTKTLSGGQKQRLMVACVLAMGQKILLLDEPLANLDREGSRLLLDTLKGLCAKGYAVFLCEHRLDVVSPYVDRVFSLEGGTVKALDRGALSYGSLRKVTPVPAPPCSAEVVLAAKKLGYAVKDKVILKDVTFSLRRGERIVLLGENGSGKTTLLRLLAGLIKPTSGAVESALGVKRGSRKWFQSVGYITQEPSYQLFMPTVRDEVSYGAKGGGAARCMEAFGLEELSLRHPHALSEGQKRRLSIAAVSATAPQVLLLDEPTVGQDSDRLEGLVRSLNAIHAETGCAMVTVTHDYRCAEALCDRVLWIKDGALYREGGKELIEEYFYTAQEENAS